MSQDGVWSKKECYHDAHQYLNSNVNREDFRKVCTVQTVFLYRFDNILKSNLLHNSMTFSVPFHFYT